MYKKALNLFFISLLFLFLVSSVSSADIQDDNMTILSDGDTAIHITSDLSNDEIQSKFDNANDGDTLEFTDEEYNNISLVVDKKLNIISKMSSTVHASDVVNDKAKSMGIDKTFGFYFTSKAAGSVLSGITIIASDSDYGVLVDNSNNIKISDNKIAGGQNGVFVKNSDKITLYGNDISRAKQNGIKLQDVQNSLIEKNEISYNKKSGIETTNMHYCNITNNSIHHNDLNGITVNGVSSNNLINHNNAFENTNGIYINSTSANDVVKSNSLTHSRKDPRSSMGGFETGNGFLLGSGFRSSGNSILKVEHNYLAHNEFFQAKNYWENDDFPLGENWYDSTDPENTFVCPRLIASLMRMDSFVIGNTIGFQMRDSSGNPVNEFATFQARVDVDGNQYTATFINGRAIIDAEVDPNVDHQLAAEIGGRFVKFDLKASGDQGNAKDSQTSSSDGKNGNNAEGNDGASEVQGNSNSQGTSTGGDSSGSHVVNSDKSGNYGKNSSDIPSQDTSDRGNDALSNGDLDAGDSGSGDASEEGKAYEIVPPVTTSKELTNTSGLVVLSILSIMFCLIYGYWRKEEFEE
ncbi:nitrous oxide reductase family maturation protein NosD [Methanobrevibacter sp.]|uniref:right-handed parallel beta-helix repeat-containing protein n=1 Tax=Methanobrevibacter sp. TaxID=66852 RepID=UPI0025D75D29|nr:right-handed parallel beta-helix repeat-containing protein [Methanobrevibacter sp.]MBR4447046.1 right-handed parallel beta-helix repeat-containing protein [Methanobrevibacter sp.]